MLFFIILIIICALAQASAQECLKQTVVYAKYGALDRLKKCTGEAKLTSNFYENMMEELIAASCYGQLHVVNWLIGQGAKTTTNRRDLVCAVGMGHVEVVKALLAYNPNTVPLAMLLATDDETGTMVGILIKYAEDPNAATHCYTPIDHAPEFMYDGISAYVPTCKVLAQRMIEEHNKKDL